VNARRLRRAALSRNVEGLLIHPLMAAAFPFAAARWPLIALIASLAMLAAAHGFERFGGLAPCALCLTQREVYWGAATLAGVALAAMRLWPRAAPAQAFNALLGIAFLAGAGVAGFHMGVEFKWWPGPASCAGGGLDGLSVDSLAEALTGAATVVRCDEAAWVFLGLSMAGWNMVISLGLAAVSLVAAMRAAEEGRSLDRI
jgi:disulfide bond formation protein DsbB